MQRLFAIAAVLTVGLTSVRAQENGFKPMFNGKDLTGWHNVNCAPGTFFVKDNMIITSGVPTGYLRTDKQYENFILEFEWFHAPAKKGAVGNSGLFVWGDPIPAKGTGYTRSIEVQVLVNLNVKDTYTSHGDLFSIWGAKCKPDRPHPKGWERCLPSENVCKGEYEWNHYRVVANNGTLKLSVNGKEVSGVTECNPRKGYLALESEGSECRFKNIKIKELPSTNPKPSEVCDVAKGLTSLFTGVDLTHWKANDDQKVHWIMKDGVLRFDGKGKENTLWTEKAFGDFEMVVDWTGGKKGKTSINIRGEKHPLTLNEADKGGWNRSIIVVKGNTVAVRHNGESDGRSRIAEGIPASGPIGLQQVGDSVQFRNVFIRELKAGE